MTIVTIAIVDLSNPVELQTWFDEHPDQTIINTRIFISQNLFFLIF